MPEKNSEEDNRRRIRNAKNQMDEQKAEDERKRIERENLGEGEKGRSDRFSYEQNSLFSKFFTDHFLPIILSN